MFDAPDCVGNISLSVLLTSKQACQSVTNVCYNVDSCSSVTNHRITGPNNGWRHSLLRNACTTINPTTNHPFIDSRQHWFVVSPKRAFFDSLFRILDSRNINSFIRFIRSSSFSHILSRLSRCPSLFLPSWRKLHARRAVSVFPFHNGSSLCQCDRPHLGWCVLKRGFEVRQYFSLQYL